MVRHLSVSPIANPRTTSSALSLNLCGTVILRSTLRSQSWQIKRRIIQNTCTSSETDPNKGKERRGKHPRRTSKSRKTLLDLLLANLIESRPLLVSLVHKVLELLELARPSRSTLTPTHLLRLAVDHHPDVSRLLLLVRVPGGFVSDKPVPPSRRRGRGRRDV
jgi:hypothetical protein